MKNTRLLISVLAFFVACVAPLQSAAQKFDASPSVGFTDGIDRTAPDFVKASLLIMSPGDELYSCAGHSCIRLECPKFNLDYCFSYESESVKDKVFNVQAIAASGELGGMATAKDFLAVRFKRSHVVGGNL